MELLHRRIPSRLATYPRCHAPTEIIIHCLFSCEKAKEVWNMSPYCGITAGEEENLFFKCWEAKKKHLIFNPTEEQNLVSLGIYCWCIWRSHNDHVFGQGAKTPQEVDGLARRMINWVSVTANEPQI
ncbi:uncharacterized protein [Arachis hypogaea]|uniref:uncharacterized protein n=1 Tax=Arachis hypogaea TaxID=3818 RepID=UPI003B217559